MLRGACAYAFAGCAAQSARAVQPHARAFMLRLIPQLLSNNAFALAEASVSQREASGVLTDAAGRLAAVLASHFRADASTGGAVARGSVPASIEGLVDIEEGIWSPLYGIKGVIDATVLARMQGGAGAAPAGQAPAHPQPQPLPLPLQLVPIEFKSGKRYYTHAAQVRCPRRARAPAARGAAARQPRLARCRFGSCRLPVPLPDVALCSAVWAALRMARSQRPRPALTSQTPSAPVCAMLLDARMHAGSLVRLAVGVALWRAHDSRPPLVRECA